MSGKKTEHLSNKNTMKNRNRMGIMKQKETPADNNLMLPLESVCNILAEFTHATKTCHFEASDTIDGKIFISADFFVKAYNCQIFVDCNRQRLRVEDGTYATCEVKNAIVFIRKGSILRIKLKYDFEHKWKFNISPLNGIDSPIESLGWNTRHYRIHRLFTNEPERWKIL